MTNTKHYLKITVFSVLLLVCVLGVLIWNAIPKIPLSTLWELQKSSQGEEITIAGDFTDTNGTYTLNGTAYYKKNNMKMDITYVLPTKETKQATIYDFDSTYYFPQDFVLDMMAIFPNGDYSQLTEAPYNYYVVTTKSLKTSAMGKLLDTATIKYRSETQGLLKSLFTSPIYSLDDTNETFIDLLKPFTRTIPFMPIESDKNIKHLNYTFKLSDTSAAYNVSELALETTHCALNLTLNHKPKTVVDIHNMFESEVVVVPKESELKQLTDTIESLGFIVDNAYKVTPNELRYTKDFADSSSMKLYLIPNKNNELHTLATRLYLPSEVASTIDTAKQQYREIYSKLNISDTYNLDENSFLAAIQTLNSHKKGETYLYFSTSAQKETNFIKYDKDIQGIFVNSYLTFN